MRTRTPNTDATLNFLDNMFNADATRHLVAIGESGKVVARSFGPAERDAARAWIEERQGKTNLYYPVNELKPSVRNRKATKEDVSRALYLHVDVDDMTALPALLSKPRRQG